MKATTKTALIEFLTDRGPEEIDFEYYLESEDFQNFEDVHDIIDNNNGFNIDIIYYSNAIKYLSENDPSLCLSIELAAELGYQTHQLNSELLASILVSDMVRQEFHQLERDFTNLLEELESIEENV